MQQRQLVWLIGALAILLVIAFISGTFNSDISTIEVPNLAIQSDEIEEIELTMTDASITRIQHKDDTWRLVEPVNASADSLTVARFNEGLEKLMLETVVSNSPERYANYGVGEDAQKVKITWGQNTIAFFIGNAGPDFQSFYTRLEGDPRVFLTRGRLTIPDHSDPWRDKNLINVRNKDIDKIVLNGPDDSFEVENEDDTWMIIQDNERNDADSADVATWIQRFAPLKGLGFLDEPSLGKVKSEASHQIHFSLPSGAPQTLWFLEDSTHVAAAVSGSDFVFRLAPGTLEDLFPDPDALER